MSAEEADINKRAVDLIQSFMPGVVGRRPANLPALVDNNGRPIGRYLTEKALGLRRENGALKLKRLTARHMRILGMRLQGLSLEQIAAGCSCTIATASRVINDPLSQAILKRVYTDREDEIKSLAGNALEAVRSGLHKDQPIGTRLRAVDKYAKIREVMLPKEGDRDTAEDVIARMLGNATILGNVNVQINNGESK